MAQRTIEEIQESILLKKTQTESLNALDVLTNSEKTTLANVTSTSKVAIWRLWVYIYAFAIWMHEAIFETHKEEIEELIALNKIHTTRWYRGEALKFQLGFDLPETGVYDNEGVEASVILDSLVVKQASVEEIAGKLRIKVATEDSSGNLAPLDSTAEKAFKQYMGLVRDAGTRLEIISRNPDDFKAVLDVYFDPLILDLNGARLDGGDEEPVIGAIDTFLRNLEFNGEFLTDNFEAAIKSVQGVQLLGVQSVEARFGTNPYEAIEETYLADAGYMSLNVDETVINYIPREVF